jgi:hypothetical protein
MTARHAVTVFFDICRTVLPEDIGEFKSDPFTSPP